MTATDELDDFYAESVTTEPFLGHNGTVRKFGSATAVLGLLKNGNQLVRNEAGAEVTSTAQFTTRPEHVTLFPPNSRVSIGTRKTTVITATSTSPGALDLPAHCRVMLA